MGVRVIQGLLFDGVAQAILWFGLPKAKDDSSNDGDLGNGGFGAGCSGGDPRPLDDLFEDRRAVTEAARIEEVVMPGPSKP
jgi:hypothetical protein